MKSSKSLMNEKQLYPNLAKAFNELRDEWLKLKGYFKLIRKEYSEPGQENLLYKAKQYLSKEVFDVESYPEIGRCFEVDSILPWLDFACEYTGGSQVYEDSMYSSSLSPKIKGGIGMICGAISDKVSDVQDAMYELSDETIDEICSAPIYPFNEPFTENDSFKRCMSHAEKFIANIGSKESYIIDDDDTDLIKKLERAVLDTKNGVSPKYNRPRGVLMRKPTKSRAAMRIAANESADKTLRKKFNESLDRAMRKITGYIVSEVKNIAPFSPDSYRVKHSTISNPDGFHDYELLIFTDLSNNEIARADFNFKNGNYVTIGGQKIPFPQKIIKGKANPDYEKEVDNAIIDIAEAIALQISKYDLPSPDEVETKTYLLPVSVLKKVKYIKTELESFAPCDFDPNSSNGKCQNFAVVNLNDAEASDINLGKDEYLELQDIDEQSQEIECWVIEGNSTGSNTFFRTVFVPRRNRYSTSGMMAHTDEVVFNGSVGEAVDKGFIGKIYFEGEDF